MTDQATRTRHAIDYIELPAVDLDASQAFYAAAFGWTFNAYGPDYAGILDGRTEGGAPREAGGLRRDAKVTPGGALVILYSDAIEESLASVRAAGGRITKEIFAFPGGRRFHFEDPAGLELAVWTET